KADAERAREILQDVERRRSRRREALMVRCPKCGTPAKPLPHPLRRAGVVGLVALIAVAATGAAMDIHELFVAGLLAVPLCVVLLVWSVTPRWICPACGHRWAQKDPDEELDEEEEDEDADD